MHTNSYYRDQTEREKCEKCRPVVLVDDDDADMAE
jgi:hypothetical protein